MQARVDPGLPRVAKRPADPADLRVAAVLDEMSAACFRPECDLIEVTPDTWREQLEAREPHLLLVESAWHGGVGSWQYQVASYSHPQYAGLPALRALLDWCREHDVPSVFWNKEDPVHFDRFKEAAALFDVVFTTDARCVPRYADLPIMRARSIEPLPFAAQPRIHNPVGAPDPRSDAPCFAGTYYRDRHDARRPALEMLLDAAVPFDLVIYDRTFGSESDSFGFPERFLPHIHGRLPYDRMVETYKAHKLFLNVNSVADSPTMCSRRVFELLACGTAVVSTESAAIRELFGDLVPIVSSPEEATEAVRRLLEDEEHRLRMTGAAARRVLSEHTYARRLEQIGRAAGYDVSARVREGIAAVAVLGPDAAEAGAITRLLDSLARQSERPAEVLVGVPHGDSPEEWGALERRDDIVVRVVQQTAGMPHSERVRELAALSAAPWLAPVEPGVEYAADFLADLLASTRYAQADIVAAAGVNGDRPAGQRYAQAVDPRAALARTELVRQRGWPDGPVSAAECMPSWFREGVRCYVTGSTSVAQLG